METDRIQRLVLALLLVPDRRLLRGGLAGRVGRSYHRRKSLTVEGTPILCIYICICHIYIYIERERYRYRCRYRYRYMYIRSFHFRSLAPRHTGRGDGGLRHTVYYSVYVCVCIYIYMYMYIYIYTHIERDIWI